MPKVSVVNGDPLSICTCPNKLLENDVQYKSIQGQYRGYVSLITQPR